MQMAVGLSGAPTAFLAGWLGITTMALSCAVHSFMAACCRCGDIIRPWSVTAQEHEHTTETTAQPASHCGQALQQAAHRVAAAQGIARQPQGIRFCGGRRRQQLAVQGLLRWSRNAGKSSQAAGAQHLQGPGGRAGGSS